MDALFYKKFKIPVLKHMISQSLNTAQLTSQLNVYIQN